ncbi:hypothetical protein ACIQFP_11875 [Nocardiopsis alba]|uniref:Uncharacterized protein n=1 Tax=Nocardiopsis alba TaxID=53437 RepID=A0A7K2J028_9ACTN|nr:hypothetical protein [Nocardiopsis alba]
MVPVPTAVAVPLATCALVASTIAPAHAATEGALVWTVEGGSEVVVETPELGCAAVPEEVRSAPERVSRFHNATDTVVHLIGVPCDPAREGGVPSDAFEGEYLVVAAGGVVGSGSALERARSVIVGDPA